MSITAPLSIDQPDLALAEAPAGGRPGDPLPAAASAFRLLNRWFMVPVTRAGLGAWVSTPLGGAVALLRIRGRKSGLVRETPLNYVVAEGSMWVVAGFGPRTEWYRNLLVDPHVEAVLPGRVITGRVTEVRDRQVRRRIIPAVMRSTPVPAMASGINPFSLSPDEVLDRTAYVPLLRIDPDDGPIQPCPDDPGGSGWIWRQVVVVALTMAMVRGLRQVLRVVQG